MLDSYIRPGVCIFCSDKNDVNNLEEIKKENGSVKLSVLYR